jgi:hypothetical protein
VGAEPGELQPELKSCFMAIEDYLDIDLEVPWHPRDGKAWSVANAVDNGVWDTEKSHCTKRQAEEPILMSEDTMFLQLLETAVRVRDRVNVL